ncbi:hypothetical protein L6164_012231 [Bauhinia variegata]|uniref:Uncharacterized protein n=1 Tax=Bauhinia variegata TaxID=167791 RepID=A0ACB9P9E5_BAUVA|nr:hypothetical protein L6164_012231 [Bauhinia variegata]
MALRSCFPLLLNTNNDFQQDFSPNYTFSKTFYSILHPKSSLSSQNCNLQSSRNEPSKETQSSVFLSKRKLNLSAVTMLLRCFWPCMSNPSLAQEIELERYTDFKEGFTLLKPCSWMKVDKAGASVLFQEANMGSNNIGVVVNPVRISSLQQFGNPQFVADKLIQAERRKDGTKDAEVINFAERSGEGGLHIYEFEYKVDSTRGGLKRIFSAAFVASKKLYLLNISHSDKPESPLDPHKRMILEQVLHSFDAANLV